MNFAARGDEIRRLDASIRTPGSFVAIWGRREVGKSRLLIEWASRNSGLYTVADQSSTPIQRRYFASAVGTRFAGFEGGEYPNWQALFHGLDQVAARLDWRGPLIFDEFQYLVVSDPDILSEFRNWLDSPSRRMDVVVSGSSIRTMKDAIFNQRSPLYGRATNAFQITPLRPGHLASVFPRASHRELVSIYAVFGSTPRYLELAEQFGGDLIDAVDTLILDPQGPLHREPDRILAMEIPTATALRPILDGIGNGAHKVSEVADRLGRHASGLAAPLATLTEMDMIRRETPFGSDPISGKRSLYQIADPFLRMWFRVVAPNRSLLARAPRETRVLCWEKHRLELEAFAWGELSRMAVPHLHRVVPELADKGPFGLAQRYWHRNEREFDIVARSLSGAEILLGDAKWRVTDEHQDGSPIRVGSLPIGNASLISMVFTPDALDENVVNVIDASMVLEALRQNA
ncbi:MAG: ATP-binding protein [Gammaproteobacteria bacterium]|nr:ATP-binding protein [Gammaproteobacteria bacterium]